MIPEIDVVNPVVNQTFGYTSPEVIISIEGILLEKTWYSINGQINISFIGSNFKINQTSWDSLSDGIITIQIYANNSIGSVGVAEFTILKDTSQVETPSAIPGYNPYLLARPVQSLPVWRSPQTGTLITDPFRVNQT